MDYDAFKALLGEALSEIGVIGVLEAISVELEERSRVKSPADAADLATIGAEVDKAVKRLKKLGY